MASLPHEQMSSTGIEMVLVPQGEFMMGGVESAEQVTQAFAEYHRKAEDFADEYPRHRVRITRPFYFGKYEISVGQFRQFTAETGYETEAESDG